MKRILLIAFFILVTYNLKSQEVEPADDFTIELARMFAKDIFELNGVPYLQPVVKSVNVTSNTGFFNQAFIPKDVDEPYFRISVQGMYGIIPDDFKTYVPAVPNEEFDFNNLTNFGSFDIDFNNPANTTFNIQDTAGLIHYVFLVVLNDGLTTGRLEAPRSAATALGKGETSLRLENSDLDTIVKNLTVNVPVLGETKIYDFLPENIKNSIDSTIRQFPESFTLPPGSDMSSIFAAVPQFEIGSFMGTEALVRFIPPVNLGEDIGDFMFWGIGLKHSISQYFNKNNSFLRSGEREPFQMAVQAVYQGTNLKNEVGVTQANLEANATILNVNIHASYDIEDLFSIYAGFSYDQINITSKYTYYLPIEVQAQLGMIPPNSQNNGDPNPQTTSISLDDSNIRGVFGISKELDEFIIYADMNFSVMNIFHAGVSYTF